MLITVILNSRPDRPNTCESGSTEYASFLSVCWRSLHPASLSCKFWLKRGDAVKTRETDRSGSRVWVWGSVYLGGRAAAVRLISLRALKTSHLTPAPLSSQLGLGCQVFLHVGPARAEGLPCPPAACHPPALPCQRLLLPVGRPRGRAAGKKSPAALAPPALRQRSVPGLQGWGPLRDPALTSVPGVSGSPGLHVSLPVLWERGFSLVPSSHR